MISRVYGIALCTLLVTIVALGGRTSVGAPAAQSSVSRSTPERSFFQDWQYPASDFCSSGESGKMHSLQLVTDASFKDVWKFYAQRMGAKAQLRGYQDNKISDIDLDKLPKVLMNFGEGGRKDDHPCLASVALSAEGQEAHMLQDMGPYSISVLITYSKTRSSTYITLLAIEK